jgi:HlyD family secretion protein
VNTVTLAHRLSIPVLAAALAAAGCRQEAPVNQIRVSGYVDATDVQVAPEVGGRILDLRVDEGDRVAAGEVVARLDTADTELALARLRTEREQAQAQLRLVLAGARVEDVRVAEAQVASAEADVKATQVELASAASDLERFESLLQTSSGSEKQRDDARTRRDLAQARLDAAKERVVAAKETLARLRAGARKEEIDVARARVATAEAQIKVVEKSLADATVTSPLAGVVSTKVADAGEIVAPRSPIVVVTDLDHAWANVYVDEPLVPRITLGQKATLVTDAGQRIEGTVTFVSPKAEFTPRNVQTADERAKLVYRVKVTVDNSKGVLKQGMPVEAILDLK